jgi:hypothetical protein
MKLLPEHDGRRCARGSEVCAVVSDGRRMPVTHRREGRTWPRVRVPQRLGGGGGRHGLGGGVSMGGGGWHGFRGGGGAGMGGGGRLGLRGGKGEPVDIILCTHWNTILSSRASEAGFTNKGPNSSLETLRKS